MEKENKYYTPEIEEFYSGFEYEHLERNGTWKKVDEFSNEYDYEDNPHYEVIKDIEKNKIRVKYLDKEDIESLSWIKEEKDSKFNKIYHLETPIYKLVTNGTFLLVVKPFCNKITIKIPNFIRDGSGNFDGYITKVYEICIKNKSELKKLMIQLGI